MFPVQFTAGADEVMLRKVTARAKKLEIRLPLRLD